MDFNSLPHPIEAIQSVFTANDWANIQSLNNSELQAEQIAELNKIPKRMFEFVNSKKKEYGGNLRNFVEHVYAVLIEQFSNQGLEESIKEGVDPILAMKDPFVEQMTELLEKSIPDDQNVTWSTYCNEFMEPKWAKALGVFIDEF